MRNSYTSLVSHPYVLASVAAAVVVALGSGFYYYEGTRAPSNTTPSETSSSTAITGSGIVEASQNGTLAFQSSGRVTRVPVVGSNVKAGDLLASLDTAGLSAALLGAQANLKTAQAKLDQLHSGPRTVDLAPKQTALASAQQTLANDYTTAQNTLQDAYSALYNSIHSNTDWLIINPGSPSANFTFQAASAQSTNDALSGRLTADSELAAWKTNLDTLGGSASPTSIDAALTSAVAHAGAARSFGTQMTTVLSSVIVTQSFPVSSVTTANADVGALRTTIATEIAALQAIQQKIANDKLSIQSAQDALALAQTPATTQDLEVAEANVESAQASVAADVAQLRNAQIVAPFAGTVGSVQVKVGDIVSSGVPAVAMTPLTALQVSAYFSEVDAAPLTASMPADITLDAYGEDRHFAATVVSVDRSPTMTNKTPAYKVVLQFVQNDPAITVGMGANVTINH